MNVKGSFVIKDSDNCVHINIPTPIKNSITGYDLHKHPDVSNIPGKSFLLINEHNLIQDIIENQVVSNIICLGVYAFNDVELFKKTYEELIEKQIKGELFVSHVISYILSKRKESFEYIEAEGYDDWGTFPAKENTPIALTDINEDGIPEMILQYCEDENKTLTDEEVTTIFNKIINNVVYKHNAILRDN